MRRWIFGVLATFGVTAALAVPLLTGSGTNVHPTASGRVGNGQARQHTRVAVVFSPDCYSGALLSLSTVERAFSNAGVPLRQTDPPHGHLDWLALRHRLPKNDYAWLWLNTVPYKPCGTNQTVHVKNLEIAYQTPAALSRRIKSALSVLRRIPTGTPPGALTVTQVESAFAHEHFTLRSQTTSLMSLVSGGSRLLAASGLPRDASLAVLVEHQPGNIAGLGSGRWPIRERNFANISVSYDLPPGLATRAEAAITELRTASRRAS